MEVISFSRYNIILTAIRGYSFWLFVNENELNLSFSLPQGGGGGRVLNNRWMAARLECSKI